jgi:hypothetical protein
MVSINLLMWCIGVGCVYLLLMSLLTDWLEKKLKVTHGIPQELIESGGCVFFIMNFVMETLFYIVIPAIGYGFFYMVLPFTGTRAGFAAALFAFVLGAAPLAMRLSVRLKLPMPYVLFLLSTHLLKLAGALAIIGYLYAL